MGANMLNLGGKSLANEQYACACARVRQDLSNTVSGDLVDGQVDVCVYRCVCVCVYRCVCVGGGVYI